MLKSQLIELKKIGALTQRAAIKKRLSHKNEEVQTAAKKRLVVLGHADPMSLPAGCEI